MNLEDYVAAREARDPEFRDALVQLRPEYEFRLALIQARLAAGLTQEDLAARIGTRQPAIARLESGTVKPSFDMLRRLSSALQVSFEILPTGAVRTHQQVAMPV